MAVVAELLFADEARYMVHCESINIDSGYPILFTASKVALAMTNAVGLALPISSLANINNLRAINFTSSPPSIILANQYTAALGSLPRIDLMNAEMIS